MKQILLAYGLPKEIVAAIMMYYKSMKVKFRSPDRDRLLWHCCWCFARGYIISLSVHNLPRLRTSNFDRFNERNCFTLKKARSRRYPAQYITDVDYANDIALLANTPTQAESLLHSLEFAAVGLHVNTD